MYCPNDNLPESQMAVFVIHSVEGGDNFPYAQTPYFTDVPSSNLYFPWIQKEQDYELREYPCSAGPVLPGHGKTGGIMAVLIISKADYGDFDSHELIPPRRISSDVPTTHPYFPWIQKMKQLGITSGCEPDHRQY